MADPPKRRATYQDVLDAPADRVAEIVGGALRLSPRPGDARVRAEPFDALELARPWANVAPPPPARASEPDAAYELSE